MIVWVLMIHLATSQSIISPMVAFKNQDDCFDALHSMNDGRDLAKFPPYVGGCIPFATDEKGNPEH